MKPSLSLVSPNISPATGSKLTEEALAELLEGIAINEDGQKLKEGLLTEGLNWTALTTIEERDKVIALSQKIDSHLKSVETSRKTNKDPFRKVGDRLDEVAKAHRVTLEAEKLRLDKLTGAFEAARIERDRQEQLAIARRAQEAQAAADRAKNEAEAALADTALSNAPAADLLEAELEAENKELEAKAAQRRAEDDRIRSAELARSTAASGGAQRWQVEIEVLDIKELYAKHPDCVKLVPDLVQIKFLEARGTKLAGVKVTKTPIYGARSK